MVYTEAEGFSAAESAAKAGQRAYDMTGSDFKQQERNTIARQDADAYASQYRQAEPGPSFMENRRKTVFLALVILAVIVIAVVTNL